MVTVIKKGTSVKEINKAINKVLEKSKKANIRQFAGSLKTDIDPLAYQKDIRSEW